MPCTTRTTTNNNRKTKDNKGKKTIYNHTIQDIGCMYINNKFIIERQRKDKRKKENKKVYIYIYI